MKTQSLTSAARPPDPLFTEVELREAVARLAAELDREYERGRRPVFLVVLSGAFVFAADLLRALKLDPEVAFVRAKSYGDGTVSSGEVRLEWLDYELDGRDVVVVEDIVDTGRTLSAIVDACWAKGAESVRVAALFDKPTRREVDVKVDWAGLSAPDGFIAGYGIDGGGRFRSLPYVGVVEENG